MARRLKLSPLQRDVLVTLEEAGGETVGTVIATINPPDPAQFDKEVDGLVKLGLIRKEGSTTETELILTKAGMEALRK